MTEPSLLDMELLDESAEMGMDDLRELIGLYFIQADEIIASLQTAIQDGQSDHVNALAHKLAGSSAVCGIAGMVGPLRTLECRGHEGQLSDADPLMAVITERLESCRRLLEEYLAKKGG
jgi:HPt (histidine-containing phosphotransfer) domain-containing protein